MFQAAQFFASAVFNYTHRAVSNAQPDYVAIETPENSYEIYVSSVLFLWLPLVRNVSNLHFIDWGFVLLVCTFVLQFQVHTKKTWREPAETSNAWLMSSIARLVRYGGRWKRNISKIS